MIHYFHNNDKENCIILQIARFNEAVCIFEDCLKPEYTLPKQLLTSLRSALNNYIKVIKDVSQVKTKNEVPKTFLSKLEERKMLKSKIDEN